MILKLEKVWSNKLLEKKVALIGGTNSPTNGKRMYLHSSLPTIQKSSFLRRKETKRRKSNRNLLLSIGQLNEFEIQRENPKPAS